MAKLNIRIESGDLGNRAGDCHTTVGADGEINILFDPNRIANPNGIRDLIMRELDLALMCLVYGVAPDEIRSRRDEIDAYNKVF